LTLGRTDDVVREFLEQSVEVVPGGDEEAVKARVWVVVKDLFQEFDSSHKALQRDRMPKLQMFSTGVQGQGPVQK
jgi:hypothetical protein